MYARILEIQSTAFSPQRGIIGSLLEGTKKLECTVATTTWQGYHGPFLDLD